MKKSLKIFMIGRISFKNIMNTTQYVIFAMRNASINLKKKGIFNEKQRKKNKN